MGIHHLAKSLGIQDLHLMGDSMIVINWLNGKGILQVANLESWKNRIMTYCLFSSQFLLLISIEKKYCG
jgi:hypothetical protein